MISMRIGSLQKIIILLIVGALLLIEGWKLQYVISLIGFCLIVFGYFLADKRGISPRKLMGRTVVVFTIIGIIFVAIGMLFPTLESNNLNNLFMEILLGYITIILVAVFYSFLSSAWHGK